ncbi:hypothetical protein HK100_012637 [Physocladia obscura]|uniref:mannan endo-1,4-beta-mannosidase n=1 Tax=Physocladia obscura TaxID=109957 RepID=A0AAD5XCC5_9FUNG|nr:hypothetical protein HK100_012637 [Physocladia obscura]
MFFGFNTPNLHLIEDARPAWLAPTAWEQTDALASLAQIGATVSRIYAFAVDTPTLPVAADLFHLALAPGKNESGPWVAVPSSSLVANAALFAALDSALAVARANNVQIIIPLVDQYTWWGGIPAFCALFNTTNTTEFYTSPTITANFLAFVSYLVSRTNSITNSTYASDSAIYAWETGNELYIVNDDGTTRPPPAAWTVSVAKTIKAAGAIQNVIDGSYSLHGWDEAIFRGDGWDAIDGYTAHYYETSIATTTTTTFDSSIPSAQQKKEYVDAGAFLAVVFFISVGVCGIILSYPRLLKIHIASNISVWAFMFSDVKFWKYRSSAAVNNDGSSATLDHELMPKQSRISTSQVSQSAERTPDLSPKNQGVWTKSDVRRVFLVTVGFSILLLIGAIVLLAIGSTATASPQSTVVQNPTYGERFQKDLAYIINATNNANNNSVTGTKNKLFYVGEFGLSSYEQYSSILEAVANTSYTNTGYVKVGGALIWSLRFHSRFGGFWNHIESSTTQSYHLPGFPVNLSTSLHIPEKTGFAVDEYATTALIKSYAGNKSISAGTTGGLFGSAPKQAPILNVTTASGGSGTGSNVVLNLTWTGSAGAQSYTIQRGLGNLTAVEASFVNISAGVSDAVASGSVIFQDFVAVGNIYLYQVFGVESGGLIGPSSNIFVVHT